MWIHNNKTVREELNLSEMFMGLDHELDKNGVFIYPPIIKVERKLAGVPDSYYVVVENDKPGESKDEGGFCRV